MGEDVRVRPLTPADHAAAVAIYNHYVVNTHCTFDIAAFTVATRRPWLELFTGQQHHCVVAERAGAVLGYACSVPFKEKPAYGTSVEVSIYADPEATARGIGTAMYGALFDHLQSQPVHRAYAGIALPNDASIALHEKFGFTQVAHYHEVGFKFDRYWDVAWYERALPGAAS